MGIPAAGRHFDVRAIQLGRFVNGMFAERWGSSATMGIMSQLGIATPRSARG